jgi:signal transduction histidine kinase
VTDISDRAVRIAQLTELAQHLPRAREDERARLARNLHDDLGALLTSAKLDAARIRARLTGPASPQTGPALERLAHLVATLDEVIAIKRRITEDLMPSSLHHLGLVVALEALARDFAASADAEVHCTLVPVVLSAAVELTIYRLVQEALSNAGQHAGARHVWIGLKPLGVQAEVSVRDDGAGFDAAVRAPRSHGLVGMQFRVEGDGGTLDIDSAPGRGTCVRARLPQACAAISAVPAPVSAPLPASGRPPA